MFQIKKIFNPTLTKLNYVFKICGVSFLTLVTDAGVSGFEYYTRENAIFEVPDYQIPVSLRYR